tara:strand:+ start:4058 stop:5347 length:1290 start_codon:yes stop_codon:yes gene_type:complete
MRCIQNSPQAKVELKKISERTSGDFQKEAFSIVEKILKEVKADGDKALIKYTKQFDGFVPESLEVSKEEIAHAWQKTPISLQEALKVANERIINFHQLQIPKSISVTGKDGEELQRRWKAVERAGIYIPGGRASYPSTVLMNAIPAKVAGVKEISMVSPGDINGEINQTVLAAAHLVGLNKVFRIGGAQAIGALAYGTEKISKVDVISGPGNIYVTLAKKYVYGSIGIDSLAGPSEILIIADDSAKPNQVALDLLAQAEHDPLASAILLTTSEYLAKEVNQALEIQLKNHPRSEICQESIKNWGMIIVCQTIDSCIELSNIYAPEHLQLIIKDHKNFINKIENAGAIFIGQWTPEAVGDYIAGPNHTLPTGGNSRFSGALGVETFMKNSSIIQFTKDSLKKTSKSIIELANSEGLYSHACSIKERVKEF